MPEIATEEFVVRLSDTFANLACEVATESTTVKDSLTARGCVARAVTDVASVKNSEGDAEKDCPEFLDAEIRSTVIRFSDSGP